MEILGIIPLSILLVHISFQKKAVESLTRHVFGLSTSSIKLFLWMEMQEGCLR